MFVFMFFRPACFFMFFMSLCSSVQHPPTVVPLTFLDWTNTRIQFLVKRSITCPSLFHVNKINYVKIQNMTKSEQRTIPRNGRLSWHEWSATWRHNPRHWRGWVGDATSPRVSLKWLPNRRADRAEILQILWGILCATFGKKWPGQVRDCNVVRGKT